MRTLAIALILVGLSCNKTPPPSEPGMPSMKAEPEAAPAPEPSADGPRDEGQPCLASSDCQSGICEGQGCGDMPGVCMPLQRLCTMDLVSYCGCDGQTFEASSGCPGRRFAARGECKQAESPRPCDPEVERCDPSGAGSRPGGAAAEARPAGSACDHPEQCASGVCEGEGCGPGQGVCAAERRMCTRDLRTYCGCDGNTFRGSGTCPGKRFRARGECPGT